MAESEIRILVRAIDETKSAFRSIDTSLQHLNRSLSQFKFAFGAAFSVFAVHRLGRALEGLLSIVDEYRLRTAELAALWTTFTRIPEGKTIADVFREWQGYAETVYQKLAEIDAQILGTRQQALSMVAVFAQHGQLIDINNQKQLEGLRNILNAVQVITQGQNQEIQIRQEIHALAQGTVDQHSRLMQILRSIDPQIKEHVRLWREQGVLIERVGALLQGFEGAVSAIANTYEAQKTTLRSIVNDLLREGMVPFYNLLVLSIRGLNASLVGLRQGLGEAGRAAGFYFSQVSKRLVEIGKHSEMVKDLWIALSYLGERFATFGEKVWGGLVQAAKAFLNTLEVIGGVGLPAVLAILNNIYVLFKGIVYYAMAAARAIRGDFKGAAEEFARGRETWGQMINVIEQIKKHYADIRSMMKPVKEERRPSIIPPFVVVPPSAEEEGVEEEKTNKKYEKLLENYRDFLAQLNIEAKQGYQRELAEIERWEQEQLSKLEEYMKEGIVTLSEYEQIKLEIQAIGQQKRLNLARQHQEKIKQLEAEIVAYGQNELERRLAEIDRWAEENLKRLEELVTDHERLNLLRAEIYERAERQKERIAKDYTMRLKELALERQQEEIKTLEIKGEITKVEALKRLISLNEELIGLLYERAAAEAAANNPESYEEILSRIERLKQQQAEYLEQLRAYASPLEGIREALKSISEENALTFRSLKEEVIGIAGQIEKAFMDFFDVTSGRFLDLRTLALDVLHEIYRAIVRLFIVQPLMQLLTKAFGGLLGIKLEKGGFLPGPWIPIARFQFGGIVNRPTLGLIGEGAYPEAVVPLPDGRAIPVRFQGSFSPNITINIENRSLPATVHLKDTVNDGKRFVVNVVLEALATDPTFRNALRGV